MALDPEVKRAWVSALRSGEYRQGSGVLRYENTHGVVEYCCLGVLCDINPLVTWENGGAVTPQSCEVTVLPEELAISLDIDDNPTPMSDLDLSSRGGRPIKNESLAEMNDEGMTFDQIADVIDYFM